MGSSLPQPQSSVDVMMSQSSVGVMMFLMTKVPLAEDRGCMDGKSNLSSVGKKTWYIEGRRKMEGRSWKFFLSSLS